MTKLLKFINYSSWINLDFITGSLFLIFGFNPSLLQYKEAVSKAWDPASSAG